MQGSLELCRNEDRQTSLFQHCTPLEHLTGVEWYNLKENKISRWSTQVRYQSFPLSAARDALCDFLCEFSFFLSVTSSAFSGPARSR